MNRIYQCIAGCLFIMGLMTVAVLIRTEPTAGHGETHLSFETMLQGGDGSRHAGQNLLNWAYGVALITLLFLMAAPGLRSQDARHWLWWIGGPAVFCVAMFTILFIAYQRSSSTPGAFQLQGVPLATVILFCGVWPVPFLLTAIYVRHFRRWFFDENDEIRFEELKSQFATDSRGADRDSAGGSS